MSKRAGRAVEELLEAGFDLADVLVMDGGFGEETGLIELGFENVLLIA